MRGVGGNPRPVNLLIKLTKALSCALGSAEWYVSVASSLEVVSPKKRLRNVEGQQSYFFAAAGKSGSCWDLRSVKILGGRHRIN